MLVKYLEKDPNNNNKNMTWSCVSMDPKQGWEIVTINILGMNGDEIKVVMEFENYLPSTTIFVEVYNT